MTERATVVRPGWLEIVVGLVVLGVVGFALPILLQRSGIDDAVGPVGYGLFLAALSGVAGFAGFLVAAAVRIRDRTAFGVRAVSGRWVLIGIGAGLVAFVLARIVAGALYYLTGPVDNIQQPYTDAAGGGLFSVVLSLLFLAVLTPIGEEFLFRGVITTALLRYGALVGVLGSSLIFALAHGINLAFVTALIVGLIAAELRRRSDSVWPGVLTHVVNNLIGQLLALLLAGVI
jgi:membrane protease YdiL (CAAX protease family)